MKNTLSQTQLIKVNVLTLDMFIAKYSLVLHQHKLFGTFLALIFSSSTCLVTHSKYKNKTETFKIFLENSSLVISFTLHENQLISHNLPLSSLSLQSYPT